MSVIVVNNYENMLNIKKVIRVLIIDFDNHENAKLSIESVKKISNGIQISIFTTNNNFNEYDNVECISLDSRNQLIKNINKLISKKSEDFFCILYSGDILLDSFKEPLAKYYNQDISSIGAIIFDDYTINDKKYNYKPGFSKDLYLETDYVQNSLLINKNAFNSVKGFDTNMSKNYIRDIIFRLINNKYLILKEDVLSFKINSYIIDSNLKEDKQFLEKQLTAKNIDFECNHENNILKPIYSHQNKKASIIIPFKDQVEVTKTCIDSILNKTDYNNYEIILINNNSSENKTFEFINEYSTHPQIKILNYDKPFNWSKINNFGSEVSSGDVLIFLNNDTEVISSDWMKLLIGDALQNNVGVVGAKLFYPDYTIQHAGVVIGLNSLASHLFAGNHENEIPELYNKYRRNVSSVTGACLTITKKLFESIGKFNERFEVSFSDIEICLRLLEKGFNNIYNPNVKLFHHEMKTRSNKEFREIDRLLGYAAFKPYFDNGDPFFNKNFSLNNAKKLIIKQDGETPGFENYWKKWSKNRNTRINKIHNIINKNNSLNIYNYDCSNDDLINNGILMDNFFKNPKIEQNTLIWFIPTLENLTENILYNFFKIPNIISKTEGTKNIFRLLNAKNQTEIIKYIQNNFSEMNYEIITDVNKLPKADASFCFDWKGAYEMLNYNQVKAKFYIIMDNFNNINPIKEQTYHFDYIGICNSEKFTEKYNSTIKYFNPTINTKYYFNDENINKINRSILFHANGLQDKEFIFGIEVLKIVKEYFGNGIKIFVEGKNFDENQYDLNDKIVNLGIINSSEKLSDFYKQSQIVLNLDSTKYMLHNILNSMACGCVNITPYNEFMPNFLRDSENIIFTQKTITCISEDIIRILHDVNLRYKLVNIGLNTIKQIDSKNELENIVKFIKNPKNTTCMQNKIFEEKIVYRDPIKKVEIKEPNYEKIIEKLRHKNNIYKNNERALTLLNKRNEEKIIRLTKELNELKKSKANRMIKKFL